MGHPVIIRYMLLTCIVVVRVGRVLTVVGVRTVVAWPRTGNEDSTAALAVGISIVQRSARWQKGERRLCSWWK